MFLLYDQAHPSVVLRPSRVDTARYGSHEGASASQTLSGSQPSIEVDSQVDPSSLAHGPRPAEKARETVMKHVVLSAFLLAVPAFAKGGHSHGHSHHHSSSHMSSHHSKSCSGQTTQSKNPCNKTLKP
jgi:hypothetical protein